MSALIAVVACVLAGCGPRPQLSAPDSTAVAALRALSAERIRVVWVQDLEEKGDHFGWHARTAVIGLDSDDDLGERVLVGRRGHFTKPLITPRGDRVVYSEFKRLEAWIINWDGSGERRLGQGQAIEVWWDPRSGVEWVYVQDGPHSGEDFKENPVYRFPIDEPTRRELVWDKTPVSAMAAGSFQVSADGRRAAGLFPWAYASTADLTTGQWQRIGSGCWTGMAPDNSYRTWIFDGAHRNLFLNAADGRTMAKVNLARSVGNGGGEVYHPRWSSHPRFLAITSPYKLLPDAPMVGGPAVEVMIGRFSEDYSKVEAWVQITRNRRGDYFPDVWIDRDPLDDGTVAPGQDTGALAAATERWPGDLGGLVFRWENASRKNEVFDPVTERERLWSARLRGLARPGRFHAMDLTGGAGSFYIQEGNPELLEALKGGHGMSIEATITPSFASVAEAPIVSFADLEGGRNFALLQVEANFVFAIRTTEKGAHRESRFVIGPVAPGIAQHVAIVFALQGEVDGYINGALTASAPAPGGTFAGWTPATLTFGGSPDEKESWSGLLDGIAIYDNNLAAAQIRAHHALNNERLADRTPARQARVLATLRETTPIPLPSSIAPYRRCLVVNTYDIDRVIEGRVEGERVLVARWGILDGARVVEEPGAIGDTHDLLLERLDDHPELGSERMDMNSTEFDLPYYYDTMAVLADRRADARLARELPNDPIPGG